MMEKGHAHNRATPAVLALARQMIDLNSPVAMIVAATGMSDSTVRRWRGEAGKTGKPAWFPPVKSRPGMAITPRGVADDFLALPRPEGVPAGDLQAHVGLAVHQLRPVAPVVKVPRIPDLDALLAAHNAAGSAGVDLAPSWTFPPSELFP